MGAKNVIFAMVHLDEKTPHMHVLHVPVTPVGRLNANKIYTRQRLRKLQSGLPAHLQSRGFVIERGVEQTPGSAKKHLDTREFKQQREALEKLIQESEETSRNSRQLINALEQREEELRKSIEEYERQAEEAEKVLREETDLPKASFLNYPSVLKKASSLIEELKKAEGSRFQFKQMERTKKSLEARLDKLEKTHDDILTFEEKGIDKLIIDEAHEFKNVPTQTKLTNVAGISSSASQKALDLFMKCRYLDENTGSRGVIMATGAPLSNSVAE